MKSSRIVAGKGTMNLRVFRYDPSRESKTFMQIFSFPASECGPMLLDALNYIKDNIDSTLSYRRSCREGICGSCSMNVNGFIVLACLTYASPGPTPIDIRPLPNTQILKD